jgi:hypothetical protein
LLASVRRYLVPVIFRAMCRSPCNPLRASWPTDGDACSDTPPLWHHCPSRCTSDSRRKTKVGPDAKPLEQCPCLLQALPFEPHAKGFAIGQPAALFTRTRVRRLHSLRPSLDSWRVGSGINGFGACSAFTYDTACTLAKSPSDSLHQRLQQSRCLHCRSDCYRVERTSSRAGIPPL